MKIVTCKQCLEVTEKYEREASLFCNRTCYMDWKREHPNKRAYKGKVFFSGYFYIYMPRHPNAIKKGRYIAEHRLVLEKKLDRYLTSKEIAHHINGDKSDNRSENVELMTISQHNKHHAKERRKKKDGRF